MSKPVSILIIVAGSPHTLRQELRDDCKRILGCAGLPGITIHGCRSPAKALGVGACDIYNVILVLPSKLYSRQDLLSAGVRITNDCIFIKVSGRDVHSSRPKLIRNYMDWLNKGVK